MNKDIINSIIQDIKTEGLNYSESHVQSIVFNPVFRDLCKMNSCGRYGITWNCPPAIGDINELMNQYQKFQNCIMYSYVAHLEDSFDLDSMDDGRRHLANFNVKLIKKYKLYEYSDIKLLGCESCDLCTQCTYPQSPCRYPNLVIPSLESCGVDVLATSKNFNIKYYNGPNTVTFFTIIFYNSNN